MRGTRGRTTPPSGSQNTGAINRPLKNTTIAGDTETSIRIKTGLSSEMPEEELRDKIGEK